METGIKVIDVLCPVVAGGTVALVGTYGVGLGVVQEELVRRLSTGPDPVSLFVLIPPPSPKWPGSLEPGFSVSEQLKKDGYSEGCQSDLEWNPGSVRKRDPSVWRLMPVVHRGDPRGAECSSRG